MAFMTSSYDNLQENNFGALPKGNYEVIITTAKEQTSKNGSDSIHLALTVRNDLDQALPNTNGKYHNRLIFVDFWKDKQTGQYKFDQLQYVLNAVKIPAGTSFNTPEDFLKALLNKPTNVYVTVESDEYQGESKERNRVAPWNFHETKFPQVNHVAKATSNDPFANNSKPVDITDADLPF